MEQWLKEQRYVSRWEQQKRRLKDTVVEAVVCHLVNQGYLKPYSRSGSQTQYGVNPEKLDQIAKLARRGDQV